MKTPSTAAALPPKNQNSLDKQVSGNHYKQFKIQPVEFVTANGLNFCEGNVIKYICRHRFKDGVKDLEKAKHYIELLIDLEYKSAQSLHASGVEC